ncbi:transmembrane protein, putative [Medicago truncatula]|uniref:Transmembrane protein, putative n=1 Tax=Medicago truncatula TaxID=3880 RepID=G7IUK6_MEDTR|nr:transmembrane protein, putative [Medicago truncatula]
MEVRIDKFNKLLSNPQDMYSNLSFNKLLSNPEDIYNNLQVECHFYYTNLTLVWAGLVYMIEVYSSD